VAPHISHARPAGWFWKVHALQVHIKSWQVQTGKLPTLVVVLVVLAASFPPRELSPRNVKPRKLLRLFFFMSSLKTRSDVACFF
jgi:hypothetical protein